MCGFWKQIGYFVLLFSIRSDVFAQQNDSVVKQPSNSQQFGACDFEGFLSTTESMRQSRKERLITAKKFAEFAKDPKTVILDARSQGSFEVLRVRNSINLPYTLFSSVALEKLIPNSSTRILIYCRNNIEDSTFARIGLGVDKNQSASTVPNTNNLDVVFDKTERLNASKTQSAGLNIPVAITLRIYGYDNVWELDDIVDPFNTPIDFVWSHESEESTRFEEPTSLENENYQIKTAGPKTAGPKTGACNLDEYIEVAKLLSKERANKLLSAEQFAKLATESKPLILDCRSELSYELLHIKDSINLPYTLFGIRNLSKRIPDRTTKILIYCRNNLRNSAVEETIHRFDLEDDEEVVLSNTIKRPSAGLNIPVAIALRIYGYENVWELDEVVDLNNTPIEFVGRK